jgi:hypothetical protein
MRPAILIKRFFSVLLLVAICSQTIITAQEKASIRRSQTRIFIGFNAVPALTKISSGGSSSTSSVQSEGKGTISGALELNILFNRTMGFTTGVGYGSFSSELSMGSYSNDENLTDPENETYKHSVTGSGINEIQKISFVNVPLCFQLQIPVTHRAGFYLQTGISLGVPMGKTYSSSGTFTYTAYYPSYNVLLKDIETYGLVTNRKINSNGNLELKSINTGALVVAGFQYFVSSKIQIGIGFNYSRSLTSISNYTPSDKYELSPNPQMINSMMGVSTKTTAQAVGIRVSLKFVLR